MPRWYDLVPAHLTVVFNKFVASIPTGEVTLDLRHGHILSGSVRTEFCASPRASEILIAPWYDVLPAWMHEQFDAFVLGDGMLPNPTGQITIKFEQGRAVSGATRGVILEDRTVAMNGNGAHEKREPTPITPQFRKT